MSLAVAWVHRSPDLASFRYRAAVPARECEKLGIKTQINEGNASVVVFSKPVAEDLELAASAIKSGAKVVVDFCDDHFASGKLGGLYRNMGELATRIVTPTAEMSRRILGYLGRESTVIPDAYEQELCAPHAVGNQALWFGHRLNLQDLEPHIPNVAAAGFALDVATGPKHVNEQWVQWGPAALAKCLARSNIVLLPTRKGAEYKSPNRLLNAIRAGCFPICSRHPSYTEFRSMVWVGDMRTGLMWAKAFQDDLNGLVLTAQDYVEINYSPAAIGYRWAQMLGAL